MKYAAEMASSDMICIPVFMNIGSGVKKLIGGNYRQHSDHLSLLLFFQYKESRLKIAWQIFMQVHHTKFRLNPSGIMLATTCGHTCHNL
jgi:hypothetical protein